VSRTSSDQFDSEGILLNGFDYDYQAWVKDGKYVRCRHLESLACGCFGREHEGQPVKGRVSNTFFGTCWGINHMILVEKRNDIKNIRTGE